MSIRRKVFLYTVLVLMLTNGAAYLFFNSAFTQFVHQRYGQILVRNTNLLSNQIEQLLDNYTIQIKMLSTAVRQKDEINPKVIAKFSQQNAQISTVSLFRGTEQIYPRTGQNLNVDFTQYKNLIPDQPQFEGIHISAGSGDTVLTVINRINDTLIMAMDFKLDAIYYILKKFQGFAKTDEAFLVNANGFLVTPSRFREGLPFKRMVHLPQMGEDPAQPGIYQNYLDEEVFGIHKSITRIGCILVNEQRLVEANQPLHFISTILLWSFLILFVVILVAALIGAQQITGPLKKLRKNVQALERGKTLNKLVISREDEIGDLAHSFQRLHERISNSEKELKEYSSRLEEKVRQRTSELDEQLEMLRLQKSESIELARQLEKINATLYDEINEREKAEKALKESEMRYRIVSDISSDYAYALEVREDGSLDNLWMTGAFEKMTGFSRNEINDRGGWEYLIHPEDTAIALRQVGIYLSGQPSTSEYRIISKSGDIRWVHDHGRPEWDAESQRVKFIFGAIRDITLQREAEMELKNSERSYRELFDNNLDAIYIQDADTKFITVNRGAEIMYGYPKEFFIGKTPEFIAAPGMNDLGAVGRSVELAFNGIPQRFEFWGLRKNGQIFPKEVHLYKGTYFGKEVIIAYAQDISSRKAAEAEVKRLSQAVEQSPITVLITDFDGNIEYTNHEFELATGYKQSEILYKKLVDLRAEQSEKFIYDDMQTILQNGHVWRGELLSRKKDGTEFWEEATVSPVLDETGKISNFIAFKKDITENKKLEEQFRQSQKMEAIGRLAGGVAHDFNNLLTVIIGYSELILSQIAEEDSLYAKIRQIDKAGRRAEALTRQLLAFSRKQILQPKTIHLNQMIGDMEKMLKRLIGEHIELQTILAEDLNYLQADPGQMEQVIMNLCINARDAMEDGGKLLITTRNRTIDDSNQTEYEDMNPGVYVELNISDTGVGMDEALKTQIFEPFFTTKARGKGTGLGLSTVYGIIKQSNGNITVESVKNKGTSFKILFPQTDAGAAEGSDLDIRVSELKGHETLLLVEDEEALRAMAEETLVGAGYTVLKAEDGEKALNLSINYNQKIDLILTDIVMPRMNGRKLAEEIVKIHPQIHVLFMSGYTDDAILQHGVLDQNTEFIPKPFKPKALLHKIRLILDQTPQN